MPRRPVVALEVGVAARYAERYDDDEAEQPVASARVTVSPSSTLCMTMRRMTTGDAVPATSLLLFVVIV